MPNVRLDSDTKKRLLINANELFGALGVELSEEQRLAAETAEESHARHRAQVLAWVKEHRELCNERMRAYRAANREKVNARARELYDPEKAKARCKRYYYQTRKARRQENKEAYNAYERARYQKKREQKLAACKAYRDAHRDEINARRRARYDPEKEAERRRRKRAQSNIEGKEQSQQSERTTETKD